MRRGITLARLKPPAWDTLVIEFVIAFNVTGPAITAVTLVMLTILEVVAFVPCLIIRLVHDGLES